MSIITFFAKMGVGVSQGKYLSRPIFIERIESRL